MTRQPSKRTPTKKELGQLGRIYPPDKLVAGKNGGVWVRRDRG